MLGTTIKLSMLFKFWGHSGVHKNTLLTVRSSCNLRLTPKKYILPPLGLAWYTFEINIPSISMNSHWPVTPLQAYPLYMDCLFGPSLATCCAVQLNDDDTDGIVRVLLPAPAGWRKVNGKSLLPLIALWKTDRTSSSTSFTVIVDISRIFPISPFIASQERYFPRGYGKRVDRFDCCGKRTMSISQHWATFGRFEWLVAALPSKPFLLR